MKTLPLAEAKAKLGALVDQINTSDEEIVITRNGRAVAVLVSSDEYANWKETHAVLSDAALLREIRKGAAALKARKARLYTLDELFL